MKKPIFYRLLITSFFILGFLLTPIQINAQGTETNAKITYEVTDSNNNTLTWFNSDFSQSFNYHIENGSDFQVNITDLNDPISEISLNIGNLTRTGILDNEAESSLALGYWQIPNVFGFVANTNWEEVKSNFTALELNSSTFHNDLKFNVAGELRDVVNIGLFDGFQQTNLLYDKELGFLIKAFSTFGNYKLEFELTGIETPLLNQIDTNNAFFPTFFFVLVLPILVWLRKTKLKTL